MLYLLTSKVWEEDGGEPHETQHAEVEGEGFDSRIGDSQSEAETGKEAVDRRNISIVNSKIVFIIIIQSCKLTNQIWE